MPTPIPAPLLADALALWRGPPLADFADAMFARAAIARKLGPALGADVRIVSVSLDPEHDSPAELAKYAQSHGASEAG